MTDVDWELMFRYFGNECTPDERERFERWLAADPKRQKLVDAAVAAAGRTLDDRRVAAPARRVLVASRRPDTSRFQHLAAAAALLIAVGGAVLWTRPEWTGVIASLRTPELRVAGTAARTRREIRLHDGTRVVLGASSTLRYPDEFGRGSRDVYLTGEGFFDVVHDAAHPFRVHAGHAVAEDIGTAFGVTAYAQDTTVRVVVAEGSVALASAAGDAAHGAARGVLLGRGELGSLARGQTRASVRRVNVDAYLGWTEGRLVFDETPLDEAIARLGRWYGTPFRLADPSPAPRTLTASFTTESLDDVLAALSPVLDVRFERRRDTVVVHPSPTHTGRRSP